MKANVGKKYSKSIHAKVCAYWFDINLSCKNTDEHSVYDLISQDWLLCYFMLKIIMRDFDEERQASMYLHLSTMTPISTFFK